MDFWVYDIVFLVLFSLGIFWFLRNRREELSREGWIFMWRTQFGVKAIGWFAKKFGFVMRKMQWLVVGLGVFLMITKDRVYCGKCHYSEFEGKKVEEKKENEK